MDDSKVCYLIDPEEIFKAVQSGDAARVRQLLSADTTLANAKGPHHKTPLHLAAGNGHKEIVELLLGCGADLAARDRQLNFTALDWALKGGHAEIAELLGRKGAADE